METRKKQRYRKPAFRVLAAQPVFLLSYSQSDYTQGNLDEVAS